MNLKLIDLWARIALSLWIVGILVGYLWQFRDTMSEQTFNLLKEDLVLKFKEQKKLFDIFFSDEE